MFAKLLKHEIRATGKIQMILAMAALVLGLVGALILRQMVNADFYENELLNILMIMALVVIWLTLIIYMVAVGLLLLVRFYKNKFTDEGYLTFTLPVNSHQILWSSILNTILWEVVAMLVMVISVLLTVFVGLGGLSETAASDSMLYGDMDLFGEITAIYGPAWLSILNFLVCYVAGVILSLTAITLGCSLAKKHKVLASFGVYYGINVAISTLTSVVSTALIVAQEVSGTFDTVWLSTVFQMVLYAALGVGGYLLSAWLMQSKLNLS